MTENAAPTDDDSLPPLSPAELRRYARHLLLPDVGEAGQRRLKAARILLVGAGGLGSPAALYLAAAGVGTLGLADFDIVDESNLHRQVIHGTGDVGRPKTASAAERIAGVNPHVRVLRHDERLTSANALEVLAPYDLVVDGSDNFPTRYLVNDACVLLGKPNVYGSIHRFEGQLSVFWAERGPCYRCLFAEPPPAGLIPSCAEAGVLGVLPGIIGSMQALEALKLVLGVGEPMIGRLLLFDALAMRSREMKLRRDPACPACGDAPTVTALIDYERFCGLAAADEPPVPTITAGELATRLADAGAAPPVLIDVREPHEWAAANLAEHGARLIPLGELPTRLAELSPEAETIVYCQAGARGERAVRLLREAGFADVRNLAGGIAAWRAAECGSAGVSECGGA